MAPDRTSTEEQQANNNRTDSKDAQQVNSSAKQRPSCKRGAAVGTVPEADSAEHNSSGQTAGSASAKELKPSAKRSKTQKASGVRTPPNKRSVPEADLPTGESAHPCKKRRVKAQAAPDAAGNNPQPRRRRGKAQVDLAPELAACNESWQAGIIHVCTIAY